MEILLMIVCSMVAVALLVYVAFKAGAVVRLARACKREREAAAARAAVREKHRLSIEQGGRSVCVESDAAARTQSVPPAQMG